MTRGGDGAGDHDVLEALLDRHGRLMAAEGSFRGGDIFYFGRRYAVSLSCGGGVLTMVLSTELEAAGQGRDLRGMVEEANAREINGYFTAEDGAGGAAVSYWQKVAAGDGGADRALVGRMLDAAIARLCWFAGRWEEGAWTGKGKNGR